MSYQDIDTRLRVTEAKIDFFMNATRMRALMGTGVVDAAGEQVMKQVEGTMMEFYRMATGAGWEAPVEAPGGSLAGAEEQAHG